MQNGLTLGSNYTLTYVPAQFTIQIRPTSLTVDTTGHAFVVFDCAKNILKATLLNTTPGYSGAIANALVKFTITSLATPYPSVTASALTDTNGLATVALPLNLPIGPATLKVEYAGTTTQMPASTLPLLPVQIIQNPNIGPGLNAATLYTGSRFFWTTSATSSTATLTLTATIRDGAFCTGVGDITKAKVSFFISNDGNTFNQVSAAQNLPVGLVDPTDKTTGTASATTQYNLGKDKTAQLWVKVSVGGQYIFSFDTFNVPVTVAIPGQINTMIAGGTLKNDGSSLEAPTGFLASGYLGAGNGLTSGALLNGAVDFGGQVSYTNKLTNPQGQLNATLHSYNKPDGSPDTQIHTYWAKSTSISEMSSSNGGTTVTFSSKVNLYETTGTKTGIDGGGVMQFISTKNGGTYTVTTGTGASKTYTCTNAGGCASIVIFRSSSMGGGVWFTSAWGNVGGGLPQTIEKYVVGGMTYF
jgi:hypothetical protein